MESNIFPRPFPMSTWSLLQISVSLCLRYMSFPGLCLSIEIERLRTDIKPSSYINLILASNISRKLPKILVASSGIHVRFWEWIEIHASESYIWSGCIRWTKPSFSLLFRDRKKQIEKEEREERDRLKSHCTILSLDDLVSHEKSCGTKCVPEMEKASF